MCDPIFIGGNNLEDMVPPEDELDLLEDMASDEASFGHDEFDDCDEDDGY